MPAMLAAEYTLDKREPGAPPIDPTRVPAHQSRTEAADSRRPRRLLAGTPLDLCVCPTHHERSTIHQISSKEVVVHARFLGKDPDSQVDNSPTLFVTDRTDRRTFIAQGWKVTNPEALADVGPSLTTKALSRFPRMC